MLPANLTNKIRSWRYSSSVKEEGIRADTLTVEYASIDEATYTAVAEAINAATAVGDSIVFLVNDQGVDVELFRGVVLDWRLEERYDRDKRETVGVLEAHDERGRLLTTFASDVQQFRGPTLSFASPTYNHRFSEAFFELARQAGLTVHSTIPRDYFFHQQLMTSGLSVASAMAGLLAPLQEFHGLRHDLVRSGQTYRIRERTIPLGTADFTIPGTLARVKSYRRSYPKDPAVERTDIAPAVEFTPTGLGGTAGIIPSFENNVSRTYTTPDGGSVFFDMFLGRILRKVITKRLRSGDGTDWVVVDDIRYRYGGFLRRLEGWTNNVSVNGVVQRRDVTNVIYSPDDKEAVEVTQRYIRDNEGDLVLESQPEITKAETDAGAVKVLSEDRVTGTGVIPEPRFYEFSQGDLDALPEFPLPVREGIIRPADRIDPAPQRGRSLLEVTLDIPLDLRISAGHIIDLSAPTLVTAATRFYVVGVDASWDPRSGHRMSIDGEAWIL